MEQVPKLMPHQVPAGPQIASCFDGRVGGASFAWVQTFRWYGWDAWLSVKKGQLFSEARDLFGR